MYTGKNSTSEPRLNALILMYVHMKLVEYLSLESLYFVALDKSVLLHHGRLKKVSVLESLFNKV